MDGIFLAYHNTLQFFGFEYLPLAEIENVLFETPAMKDYSFEVLLSCFFLVLSILAFYFISDILFSENMKH